MRLSKSKDGIERHVTMRDIIEKVPIPTAGVALGLTALGNLLQPAIPRASISSAAPSRCSSSCCWRRRRSCFPSYIRDDLHNSIMASVSGTVFMTLMQFSNYLAPLRLRPRVRALGGGHDGAPGAHRVVHRCASSARSSCTRCSPPTSSAMWASWWPRSRRPCSGCRPWARLIFWFGFACYAALLVLVTYRYAKHEVPEGARPLFCIYTAPMSLSIVGYLAAADAAERPCSSCVMLVLAQVLFAGGALAPAASCCA